MEPTHESVENPARRQGVSGHRATRDNKQKASIGAHDVLEEHGPGIQHVAFEVADLEAALAELAERGVTPVGEAPRPGAGNTIIAFLDPTAFGNILVELCQPL